MLPESHQGRAQGQKEVPPEKAKKLAQINRFRLDTGPVLWPTSGPRSYGSGCPVVEVHVGFLEVRLLILNMCRRHVLLQHADRRFANERNEFV